MLGVAKKKGGKSRPSSVCVEGILDKHPVGKSGAFVNFEKKTKKLKKIEKKA